MTTACAWFDQKECVGLVTVDALYEFHKSFAAF